MHAVLGNAERAYGVVAKQHLENRKLRMLKVEVTDVNLEFKKSLDCRRKCEQEVGFFYRPGLNGEMAANIKK